MDYKDGVSHIQEPKWFYPNCYWCLCVTISVMPGVRECASLTTPSSLKYMQKLIFFNSLNNDVSDAITTNSRDQSHRPLAGPFKAKQRWTCQLKLTPKL